MQSGQRTTSLTRTWMRTLCATTGAIVLMAGLSTAQAGTADLGERPGSGVVTGYVVSMEAGADRTASLDRSANAVRAVGGIVDARLTELGVLTARLTAEQAAQVRHQPGVRDVSPDRVVSVTSSQEPARSSLGSTPFSVTGRDGGVQSGATWGLDRIDQRDKVLDQKYTYRATGKGVTAYVVDTGITAKHKEFSGRLAAGFSAVEDGNGTEDCHKHGTHVSGTIAGTTYGVAKEATIVPVRVMDCQGNGPTSAVLKGVEWILQNAQLPGVVNMSFTVDEVDKPMLEAVQKLVDKGLIVTIAAGNKRSDACKFSPAGLPDAITVASLDTQEMSAYMTNFGPCVDIYAPGINIISAKFNTVDGTQMLSGTSMASPHVAGVVALYLQGNPKATRQEVSEVLTKTATRDKIKKVPADTPNLLVYSLLESGGR